MHLRTRDRIATALDIIPWLVTAAAVAAIVVPIAGVARSAPQPAAARPAPAVVATGPVVVATDPYRPGASLPEGGTEVTEKAVQVERRTPRTRAANVVIVGDSLTVGASSALQSLLADVNLWLDARVGRSMPEGAKAAAASNGPGADIAVVALGSNDSCDVAECRRRVAAVLATINPGAPVVWMLPAQFRPNMENVRTAVSQVLTRRPRSVILDWQPFQDAHPEIVLADRIHLTPAGYRLRAEVTANQVHALLAVQ